MAAQNYYLGLEQDLNDLDQEEDHRYDPTDHRDVVIPVIPGQRSEGSNCSWFLKINKFYVIMINILADLS